MRTLSEIRRVAAQNDWVIDGGSRGFYASDGYRLVPPATVIPNAWGSYMEHPWSLDVSSQQSAYSCGVGELGDFREHVEDVPNSKISSNKKLQLGWTLLLEYVLRKEKTPYLRAITTDQETFTNINIALPKAGFEKRGQTKSRHGGYPIYIWEWTK